MLRDEKILVTGPAGQIALPICAALARDNEVWGVARFRAPGSREHVESLGVSTRTLDLGDGELAALPDDFTYLLHLAAYMAPGADYDAALRVNAEGTGFVLAHCRRAKAALVMTTGSVYDPHPDAWHAYVETDPLGDCRLPSVPTYSMSKIGEEAVARTLCRVFELPVTIARMNSAYGRNGGLPSFHLDAIAAGQPVTVRWDPNPYSPIHEDDIVAQLPALLDAATVPATIVNWGGDQPVAAQEWCAHFGALLGVTADIVVTEVPGSHKGVVADNTKRLELTGPCRVDWRDGMRDMAMARHPERFAS